MFERGSSSLTEHEQAQPMAKLGRPTLIGIQERWQVLGINLWQVRRQASTRNTCALKHGLAQEATGLPPAGGQEAA